MKPIVNRELDTEQTTITQLISTDAFNVETLEQIEKELNRILHLIFGDQEIKASIQESDSKTYRVLIK